MQPYNAQGRLRDQIDVLGIRSRLEQPQGS
jgi:hypothetical protein